MSFLLAMIYLSAAVLAVSAISQGSRLRASIALLLLSWNLGLVFVVLASRDSSVQRASSIESGLGMGAVCLLMGSISALVFFALSYRSALLFRGATGSEERAEKVIEQELKG